MSFALFFLLSFELPTDIRTYTKRRRKKTVKSVTHRCVVDIVRRAGLRVSPDRSTATSASTRTPRRRTRTWRTTTTRRSPSGWFVSGLWSLRLRDGTRPTRTKTFVKTRRWVTARPRWLVPTGRRDRIEPDVRVKASGGSGDDPGPAERREAPVPAVDPGRDLASRDGPVGRVGWKSRTSGVTCRVGAERETPRTVHADQPQTIRKPNDTSDRGRPCPLGPTGNFRTWASSYIFHRGRLAYAKYHDT